MKNRKKNFLREVTKPLAAPTHGGGWVYIFRKTLHKICSFGGLLIVTCRDTPKLLIFVKFSFVLLYPF